MFLKAFCFSFSHLNSFRISFRGNIFVAKSGIIQLQKFAMPTKDSSYFIFISSFAFLIFSTCLKLGAIPSLETE